MSHKGRTVGAPAFNGAADNKAVDDAGVDGPTYEVAQIGTSIDVAVLYAEVADFCIFRDAEQCQIVGDVLGKGQIESADGMSVTVQYTLEGRILCLAGKSSDNG